MMVMVCMAMVVAAGILYQEKALNRVHACFMHTPTCTSRSRGMCTQSTATIYVHAHVPVQHPGGKSVPLLYTSVKGTCICIQEGFSHFLINSYVRHVHVLHTCTCTCIYTYTLCSLPV